MVNKKSIFKASSFVLLGYGFSQVIRLIGNLILTRLLMPEYFGIMALANIFIFGLALFSDLGIEPAVIRSARFKDSDFLNTAWTVQIIRGALLFFFSLILAYPISRFYNEPILLKIIPVAGLMPLISGFNSTSLFVFIKELRQGWINLIELLSQIVSLIIMIVLAFFFRSIWSLVIGSLFSAIVKMVMSHILNKRRNQFTLEKDSIMEIIHFGLWILFSSAMTFLSTQTDKIILGKIVTMELLGIYNIALLFSEIPKQIVLRISNSVIFPVLNELKNIERNLFYEKIKRVRRKLLYPMMFLLAFYTSFSDYVIIILYDDRYYQAAWILPILIIGMWPLLLHVSVNNSLFVFGKPKYIAFGNMTKWIYMMVMIPLAMHFFGFLGVVAVIALNDIPVYIIVNIGLIKEKLYFVKQDLYFTILLILLTFLLLGIRYFLNLGLPGQLYFNL